METSWNKVANWYDSHLKGSKNSYHNTLIIPNLIRLLKSNFHSSAATVLDLACGQGYVTNEINKSGYKVTGIDLSSELISIAKERYKDIDFIIDDASKLTASTLDRVGRFDAITIVLAVQNIKDLDGLFKGCSRLLKKGGQLFVVMNHPAFRIPKASSWGFDKNDTAQYRRIDRYMSNLEIPIEAKPGERAKTGRGSITWSFHRSLSEYFKKLKKNGFVVMDLEEWVSNKTSEPGKRAKVEDLARKEIPMFMAFVASKTQN